MDYNSKITVKASKDIEAKLSEKAQGWVSDKISYLIKEEGFEKDQAAAIAYSMARKKGYKVPKK